MNACFSPVENVARARVYFRAAGGPYWYFVEMKPGTPKKPGVGAANVVPAAATAGPTGSCFQGVLPKPKKTILKMDYYVEVVDKGFAEARTTEYQPDVVDAAGKCKRDLPIAPFVSKASVAVGAAAGAPTVPIGFAAAGVAGAAGTSTALVVAGVAGAGAAAAGVAASTGGGGTPTTGTTQTTQTQPQAPPTPTPPPPTPPPPSQSTNRP
ncbi:MAG TPA: hypothetical protein VG389_06025, partial [Myxococcota bacterium]|nr:hypothetical protein [Myxococcota bacterium]